MAKLVNSIVISDNHGLLLLPLILVRLLRRVCRGILSCVGGGGAFCLFLGSLLDSGILPFASDAPIASIPARVWQVSVEVGEGFGVVGDHGVEVEGLRVGEIGVRDGNGDVGPIGAEPAAEAVGIVAGAEVIVAGFRVALLALEFVDIAGGGEIGAFAAVAVPSFCLRTDGAPPAPISTVFRFFPKVRSIQTRGPLVRSRSVCLY